jgi:ribosomal protein S11
MDYTITLTEAENKAMEYIAADVDDWITNAATNRARIAIDEICDLYVKHKLDNNEAITATNKPDMVIAAYEEGLVKTAAQRNEEAAAQLPE